MLDRSAVTPLSTFKKLSDAFAAVAFLAAAWLVQAPAFVDDLETRTTGYLASLVLSGGILSWINVKKVLAIPWLRRLTNAAQAGTMVSVGMMAIDAVEGVIAGYRSVGAGAATLVAPITPQQVDGLMSPRVAAWAVFSFALWLLLLRLYDHRAEAAAPGRLCCARRRTPPCAPGWRLTSSSTRSTRSRRRSSWRHSEAATTADRLASLFRQVLDLADRPRIPLREELGFVETYLGIERARLGSRLRVKVEVPENVEAVEIPPLSLQVLVENAVKHGVAPREDGGENPDLGALE